MSSTNRIAVGSIIEGVGGAGFVKVGPDGIVTDPGDSPSIAAADIAAGAVTTVKLADDAVTSAKIAANAVGTSEVAAGAVTGAKIADSTITVSNLTASLLAYINDTSETVQAVSLASPPSPLVYADGGCVVVTGSTGSVTINLPSSPTAGDKFIFVNQTSVTWTLSGNGNLINGASTIVFPARNSSKVLIFDGDNWNKIADDILEGTWTPEIASDVGTITPVYTSQLGYYTVCGNTARIWGRISYSSKSGAGSGAVKLAGIPSWLQPTSGQVVVGTCGAYNDLFSAICWLDLGAISGLNFIFMKALNTQATVADMAGACGFGLSFEVEYRIY